MGRYRRMLGLNCPTGKPMTTLLVQLPWVGIGVECAALLSFIYVLFLRKVFTTLPLNLWQWLILLACPPILLGAEEL